jgi:hypothetical protein
MRITGWFVRRGRGAEVENLADRGVESRHVLTDHVIGFGTDKVADIDLLGNGQQGCQHRECNQYS